MIIPSIRAILRCLWLVGLLICLVPPAWVSWKLGFEAARCAIVQVFFRMLLFGFRIRVVVQGKMADASEKPLLLVSNHISWLDILVFASCFPVIFTPKREISRWPLVGSLTNIARVVFIDRSPRFLKQNVQDIRLALHGERPLLFFPEGTTGDGRSVLPFKSSFFVLAEQGVVNVQPVVIRYEVPGEQRHEPSPVAWYSEMTFLPHFWKVLQIPEISASLDLLPILGFSNGGVDRKALANMARTHIVERFTDSAGIAA